MPIIRQATPEDIEAIHSLGKNVPEFSVNESTVNFWPKVILASAVASDDVIILVVEEAGSIAGFIIANYNKGLHKAIVENVFVRPENRGARIGSQLLEQLLNVLSEKNCEYIAALIPFAAQDALDMYQHAGFAKGEIFLWLDKMLGVNFKNEKDLR